MLLTEFLENPNISERLKNTLTRHYNCKETSIIDIRTTHFSKKRGVGHETVNEFIALKDKIVKDFYKKNQHQPNKNNQDLLDEFAKISLQTLLPIQEQFTPHLLAKNVYQMAVAMVKERNKIVNH